MSWEYTKTSLYSDNKCKQNLFCYEDQWPKITKNEGKYSDAPMTFNPHKVYCHFVDEGGDQSMHTPAHTWEASHSRVQRREFQSTQRVSNRYPVKNSCSAREGEGTQSWEVSEGAIPDPSRGFLSQTRCSKEHHTKRRGDRMVRSCHTQCRVYSETLNYILNL